MGRSGVGKTTLVEALCEREGYKQIYSYTTREPRTPDEKGHIFIPRASYKNLDDCKEWLYDNEPCLINILLPDDTLLIPKMNWNQKEMVPLLKESVVDKIEELFK